MTKASLTEKFALIHEHWRPNIVAQLNGQELKLVKFQAPFPGIIRITRTNLDLLLVGATAALDLSQTSAFDSGGPQPIVAAHEMLFPP